MSGRSMNLMDLLSSDSNVPQSEVFNNYNYNNIYGDIPVAPATEAENPSAVYYLPTQLSTLQKDMTEAVVQIFKSTLLRELFPQRERSNINSLLSHSEESAYGNHHEELHARNKVVSLIYNQILTIGMHPSLVVDHFIPKGLLLSSTKARLCSFSGKAKLFDRVIDRISEKYELESPSQDYNLMVIANSIKELEFIEGLVIGKKLRYLNVSNGKRLYEEAKPSREKDDSPDDEQTVEYKQRHQHFEARRAGKGKVLPKEFVLHLITSSHLCSSFTSDTPFDLMVSFDSELDITSPGIELLRSPRKVDFNQFATSQSQIPILIPTPIYSVEHLSQVIPKREPELGNLSADIEAEWKRRILSVFVANRHSIFEENEGVLSSSYGQDLSSLEDLLFKNRSSHNPHKWLDKYSKQLSLETTGEKLKSRLVANHLSSLNHIFSDHANGYNGASSASLGDVAVTDYDSFKMQMARFLHARIAEVETLKEHAHANIIPKLREQEARRQEEIDEDEEQIGEHYRKLQKLNEEVSSVDKRFNRVELENQRLQESVAESSQMFDHLQDVLSTSTDEHITKIMGEQDSLLEQLEKEKEVLSKECQTLTDEIEIAREEYQQKSTQAIQVTEKLSKLKDDQTRLFQKAEGPGMSILPSLARKDELGTYEAHLCRITQENAFLNELFSSRFDKLVKERNLMDNTLMSGRAQTNRVSRAPTPL